MASNYKFSNEEMAAIKAARRETKDKRADARLKALELRTAGMELSEVSQATGFHAAYVSQVLHRHGWRKVMPRSRHPKKASEEFSMRILYFSISLHTHQR